MLYRDPLGRRRSRTFKRKTDARTFAKAVDTDKARGDFTDPPLGKTTVGQYADQWFASLDVKPKTLAGYESHLAAWIMPSFATVALTKVDPPMVRSFARSITDAGRSAATRTGAVAVLRMVPGYAVEKGAIKTNPAARLGLSSAQAPEMHLGHGQATGGRDWSASSSRRGATGSSSRKPGHT